jgi:eukaryotic-like serine/threonine-protein kinase
MSSSANEDFKGTERFSIQRRLGAGGFGVVYQAYDKERNSVVALKTLHRADAGALYRFKREFRALADIAHPNLVSLYELMSDGDIWFFTMELVEGINFLEHLKGIKPVKNFQKVDLQQVRKDAAETVELLKGETKVRSPVTDTILSTANYSVDLERLRSALKQLAEGVSALHKAGKLHRDIKPTNVLVTGDGRVVLLDFGLVTEIAPGGLHQSLDIAGTPAYMSPEQGAGLPVSETTDWYSVGVILYKVLTGRLPFSGSFIEVLAAKQKFEPPPPSAWISGIPEDLNSLCRDLLQRAPEQRPKGHEVLCRLQAAETGTTISSAPSMSRTALFVGREHHLAALKESFLEMKNGRPVAIYIHGPSGIGKSALVRRFLEVLWQEEQEAVILAGCCYEQESVPYKAFDSIVDALSQYLKSLQPFESEAYMPRDILALSRLFPVLRQVKAVAEAKRKVLEIPDSQELRRRAFTALRELLGRLADRKPLLLFIDDLQWGDVDSATLLGELLRPPDPPSLLLIGSYRSEEADTSPFLKMLIALQNNVAPYVETREIVVGELSPEEARELAFRALEQEGEATMERTEMIVKESGGSPFFINELAWYLQTEGAQEREARLEGVIEARISQLPDEARRLLEFVAVSGQPLERAVARQVAKFSLDEHKMLTLLRAGHMIRMTGTGEEKIETYHDRIRETVVEHLEKERLKDYHHSLALALEETGQADPERLVVHFRDGGDLEKAAKYAVAAANQVFESLAFDHAAELYHLALELQTTEESRETLRVKLGDALANAGRGVEATRAYLAAAESVSGVEALELRRRATEQLLHSGHIEEGMVMLRVVLKTIGMKLAETPQRVLISLLTRRAMIWLRGLRYSERNESELSPETLIRIDTCWSVALGLGIVDSARGADFQARHLLLALKAGEPFRIARALSLEAGYSSASGKRGRQRTQKLLDMATALAERVNHPYAIGIAVGMAGIVAFYQGHWKKSHELCDRAESILRENCTGVTWELDNLHFFSFMSSMYMGELNEMFRRLPVLIKDAQERGDLYAEVFFRIRCSYFQYLAADEPERAEQEIRQAMERWSQKGFHNQKYSELLGRCQIALYSDFGKSPVAWNLINQFWPLFTRSLLIRVQAVLIESLNLHARCALAAALAASDPNNLLHIAEDDARRIEREDLDWGKAHAQHIRAGIATIRGDKKRALELLDVSQKGFTATDMALFVVIGNRRRGELIGGNDGQALIEAADAWMATQQIKNPDRLAAMLTPGRWEER